MFHRKLFAAAVFSAVVAGVPAAAMASETPATWKQEHPRRAQVNQRLKNQNQRIHTEVKEGELSKSQAAQLHKNDAQIRQEERDMASQNGGHITAQEQRTLNQQLNANSGKIGN